jgi:large subunit ribosomal protein L9
VNAGPQGTLFGSVTPTDIADEIWRTLKVRVDRRKIDLDEPIKRIGRYDVPIELFTDVRVEVRTLVVPEGGELPPEEELEALAAAEEEAAAAEQEGTPADEVPEPESAAPETEEQLVDPSAEPS